MRDEFIQWFERVHPGMDVTGHTGRDEWTIWSTAYMAGICHVVELFTGKSFTLDNLIDDVGRTVKQCESVKS